MIGPANSPIIFEEVPHIPPPRPLRFLFIATNRPAITNPHRGEGWEVRQWVSHLGRKNSFTPFKRSFLPSMGNPLRICHITNSMPGRRKIIAGREENNNPKKNPSRRPQNMRKHPHFLHFIQPTPEPFFNCKILGQRVRKK